ncbi:MAG: hypothetical protein ACLFN8_04675 [Candidatus Woesearchaeota archaeon]
MTSEINPNMHVTPTEYFKKKEEIEQKNKIRTDSYKRIKTTKPIIGIAGIYTTLEEAELEERLDQAEDISSLLEYHGIEVNLPYRAKEQKKAIKNSTHILILQGQEPNKKLQDELISINLENKKIITYTDIEEIIKTYSNLHDAQKRKYQEK